MTFFHKVKQLKLHTHLSFVLLVGGILFLSLLCIIGICKPNHIYHLESLAAGDLLYYPEGQAFENQIYTNAISLKPGIYYVEQEYQTSEDRNALLSAVDLTEITPATDSSFKTRLSTLGSFQTNGEHAYRALGRTGYELWVFKKSAAACFTATYNGQGTLAVGNITITETNAFWYYLLSLIWFFGLLILFFYVAYWYDKAYSIASDHKLAFWGIFLISLMACAPYMLGCSISGADLTYHMLRIEGVKDGLLSGQFPVRLEPEWLYGHGYANAIYYCNSLLLFPGVLRILGYTVTASYNLYCIALTIATAWIAYYCFNKIFMDARIGLILSGLYTLSLFRISRLVIISATGEGTALTFLPLIVYGFYRVFSEDPKQAKYKTAHLPLIFGFAGIIQSHVLTCEMTGFLTILLCICCIKRVFSKDRFIALAKGAFGAALISLWYLVPFLDFFLTQPTNIKFATARTIGSNGLPFKELCQFFWHFQETSGMYPVSMGPVLLFGFIPACLILILQRKKLSIFQNSLAILSLLFGLGTLIVSLNIFPWDGIQSRIPVLSPLISSLQFPFRFLGWTTVCLVILWGYTLHYLNTVNKKKLLTLCCMVLFLSLCTSNVYTIKDINEHHNRFTIHNPEGMGYGYISGAEYLMHDTNQGLLTYEDPVSSKNVALISYDKKALKVTMYCENTGEKEGHVDLPLMMYKGYQAYTKDHTPLTVAYSKNNLVRVKIPVGFSGEIKVSFKPPIYWRISELITYLTALWLLYFYTPLMKKRAKK